jgi:glycosyltransferase involved in cell wall biosynthesis
MSSWIRVRLNPAEADVLEHVRLFAVLGTWMEADVVADSVRNAMTQGCERVYLVDNGSSDGTVEIAVSHGAILASSFVTNTYDERQRLHRMNAVVAEVSSAESDEHIWWLFLDADEFSHGPWGLSIHDYLKTLDKRFRIVGARYFNHFPDQYPQHVSGLHPIEFQPLCEELVHPMCPSGHRKHPLQRYDRFAAPIECGRGFHLAECADELYEPVQPIFLHHFPFRGEATTRWRLGQLWAKDSSGQSRAHEADDATGHMLPRFRSLGAVYAQDWNNVENFMPSHPPRGVALKPWEELVESEHQHIRRWSSPVGAWTYQHVPKFRYGDNTSYLKGIAFLDGHGTIEDWGCGFGHAKTFVVKSDYVGIDGSSPLADKIVDLCEYRSDADCIFLRHVLEHNVEWRRILAGAISSFRRRLVLIIFTPFADTTRVISAGLACTSVPVPDFSFRKTDLTDYFQGLQYKEESLETDTQYNTEHIFYVER